MFQFSDLMFADLYDPNTIPSELTKAHKTLDKAVDKLYQNQPFTFDTARVSLLFEKYKNASQVV